MAVSTKNHRRNPKEPTTAPRLPHPGRIALAVPWKCPTFLAGPRLREPCRREKAARAGARGFERVTGPYFNPIRIIVKLRNISKERNEKAGKIEGRRGLKPAPPGRKLNDVL